MSDHAATYGPDILLALVSTATFGGWGLAGAAVVSLARHSPVVQEGIAQLAPQLEDARRRLPELLIATSNDRALTRRADEPAAMRAHAAPAAASWQQGQRKAQQVAERPRWLEVLNDDPDRTPHTMIIGGSGVGKTTLVTAIAADRGGRVVVLSPKVAAGNWRGAEVVTLDDDGTYAPIGAALADLEDEKRRRIVALRKHGPKALEPMTIVLDELQQLTAHAPASGEFMVGLSSIGREIKMRMIVSGTTDDALNIKGWKASRQNYARIDMDRTRRATINDGVRSMTVQAQESKRLADAARLTPWRGEVEQLPLPDPAPVRRPVAADTPRQAVVTARVPAKAPAMELIDLLDDLLAQPVPSDAPPAQTTEQQVTIKRDGGDVNVYVRQEAATVARATRGRGRGKGLDIRGRRERAAKYQRVRSLVAEGKSANEIDRIVPGGRKETLALVRQARVELARQ